jgi:hypothetical protein
MSYNVGNLILDVLPRLSKIPKQSGISIYQAATSVQSLIYKRLLDRKSDLQATGDLDLNIAAGGYTATLPSGFLSMAERPKAEELYTNWMAGSVTTYNILTGALVVTITTYSGTDTLADWDLALAATPAVSSTIIGSSTTSLTVGSGAKPLTVDIGLSLVPGQAIYIITADQTLAPVRQKLQPHYLGQDDDERYSYGGDDMDVLPSVYKVVGMTLFVYPAVVMNVKITGRYNAKPAQLTVPASSILWDGMFDEVFREGVVKIIAQGISIPEASQEFMIFVNREVDTIMNSRIHLMPDTGRMKRSSFL